MAKKPDLAFEETLSEDWSKDPDLKEVALGTKSVFYLTCLVFIIGLVLISRISALGIDKNGAYEKRALSNLNKTDEMPPPRGLILDRFGKAMAENRAAFSLVLDTKEFLKNQSREAETLSAIQEITGISGEEVWRLIREKNGDFNGDAEPVVISEELLADELVQLKSKNPPFLSVKDSFERVYPEGEAFSAVLGYTGLLNADELAANPDLAGENVIGKAGLELSYDQELRGTPGVNVFYRNAKGEILGVSKKGDPQIGPPLKTTIDSEFQKYFYGRMEARFRELGLNSGAALALNPQTGEILALLSFPSYDNNVFVSQGKSAERQKLLSLSSKPLFVRPISGVYNPGSTIKPLVGVAALTEGVISPDREIFSPGYLDIPNPYDPEHPQRYLDWRYQGNVNLAAAIAQSSNVYFYEVGGGAEGINGLGISRLYEWWKKFHLGLALGIDLPAEAGGFLPTPDWKEKSNRGPWLLGDTYNVSIGQGDLLITPIQLLDYIAAIANGGKILRPVLVSGSKDPIVLSDLTSLVPEIKEVQKGMVKTVTAPLGTAYLLHDLPMSSAAKTGTAQINLNTQENAFFLGYAPAENPQIAILILVEHSREGSLNTIPVARDVLNWYYENRLKK